MIANSSRRLRRLRRTEALRALVHETSLSRADFLAPIFVTEIESRRTPIPALPGIDRIPLSELAKEIEHTARLGLKGVLLFPVVTPDKKDPTGREAFNPEGCVAKAIAVVKRTAPHLSVFADVALDPYTTHGHDGIVSPEGDVLNDETVEALCRQSCALAEAGIDFVAPSDMMDGRVGAIRAALDARGFSQVGILAYSAKYASGLYGPFREALGSGARGLNKRTYQLEPGNVRQALQETDLDVAEGADMVMVKPASLYLDIITRIRQRVDLPVAAYHVSGEYAMIKAAAAQNLVDENVVALETLTAIRRAGADIIVSYYARTLDQLGVP